MDGRRERLKLVVAGLQSGEIQRIDHTVVRAEIEQIIRDRLPADVVRPPTGILWEPAARQALRKLSEFCSTVGGHEQRHAERYPRNPRVPRSDGSGI